MKNSFIDYLNSTNNAGSDTTGALAETQVKSDYYDKMKINRKLGTFISRNISSGDHQAYILTGHAGDGKTSILVQILQELNLLNQGESLTIEREYDAFYYVKDMSEIGEADQDKILKKVLEAPHNNRSSLLISNTGPLLSTFKRLASYYEKVTGEVFDEVSLQNELLKQLDKNSDKSIEIAGYEFILVNIARVDNVFFASKLLRNIILDDLWLPCTQCPKENDCPIFLNKKCVANNFNRIIAFIENFYRYLYESDKRMTIRQIFGQLSYAVTGNLTCETVHTKMFKFPAFDYNFANLFFGYRGLEEVSNARQIKGVQQIRNLELDKVALYDDYILFVKNNFSKFPVEIQQILNELLKYYRGNYRISEETHMSKVQKSEIKLRKAIRRFYLMYSAFDDMNQVDMILNQVFGGIYSIYRDLICKEEIGNRYINEIQRILFQALYFRNTGFLPHRLENELPLTLRREDDVFQNVMLKTGEVKKSCLQIERRKEENRFEDMDVKYSVVLKLGKEHEYLITLPMLIYFSAIIEGAITSNHNPALTHGIAKLETMLHEEFDNYHENKLTILINTVSGQKPYTFEFEAGKIYL